MTETITGLKGKGCTEMTAGL
ncbi:hypothetical protein [Muriicola sp.]